MNAIMPSMGSRGMSGIGAPPIQSPAQNPQGMPQENMGQVMALARKMSDMQLADVLSGKNMDVPQFAAMTEAMGRRSLRNAMKGAQAQGQLQKPNLKQQTLAELQAEQAPPLTPQMNPALQPQQAQPTMTAAEGGLASLPAPNMESMDMAAGGIVAFADESNDQEVRDPNKPLTKEEMEAVLQGRGLPSTKKLSAIQEFFQLPENIGSSQRMRPYTQERKAQKAAAALTPEALDAKARSEGVFPEGSPALPGSNLAVAPPVATPPAGLAAAAARAPVPAGKVVAAPVVDDFKSYMDMIKNNSNDYLSKLEGLSEKQRSGLAQIRKESGGEAMMQMAAALLGTPNMAMGVSKGLPMVASTAASSRKEQRDIERAAGEMDLNIAKAREAAKRGDMDSALAYKKLADDAAYRKQNLALQQAQLNQAPDAIRTLQALRDPKMMELYKEMNAAKKPTDVVPRATALKEYNDDRKLQRLYPDFETYYKMINNQLLSATIPGQGAPTRPY